MKLVDKIKSFPEWLLITLSILLILILVVISFKTNLKKFEELSKTYLTFLDKEYKENIQLTKTASSNFLKDDQVNILLKKISIIEVNKSLHIDLIQKLSKNKYALFTMFPFMSAITAILVFLIIQQGWSSCNNYLKAYFILFTTLTSLIGIYPEVYKQTDGISKHTKSFLDYKNLQKTIFNYSITAPIIEKDSITFDRFLDNINTQERKLITLIFDIEKKSLDKEIFNSVNGNK
ncbi:hypothetical protein BTO06_12235 [Tenacibaculum sp. SZ-18]|uniref:hypothetical protein n=1 Tax=Tenacibaculum sp. SZ-18 TaxID=754423 RepID=UPI000C2D0F12|nr:hypothetical protein [Tenacibaculum sp. SZ-18]AUC15872.1 hypothetical protein BTO06_12235 [Tenacibaculum sp. SZ-18]